MRPPIWICALAGCGRLFFDPLATGTPADAPIDRSADSASPACAGKLDTTPQILIDTGSSKFCIDRTEVTAGQYLAFLSTNPSIAGQPAYCAFNNTYTPSSYANRWPVTAGIENLPVGAMDWCDARAYCAWAGKRLCGKIGGGVLSGASRGDPVQSEWTFACTMGGALGANGYPYGANYIAGKCADAVYPATVSGSKPVDVGTATECEGGYPGLFDMSGNITEWEDSCDTVIDGADNCAYRGGEYGHSANNTSCSVQEMFRRDDTLQASGGIRCCSDAL